MKFWGDKHDVYTANTIATILNIELYYNKDPQRIPKGTVPAILQDYNSSLKSDNKQTTPQTTVGMTYPIATGSNNLLQTLEDKIGLSSTSNQTTVPMITASLPTDLNASSSTSTTLPANTLLTNTLLSNKPDIEEHPSILDENNAIVSKCRRDAMRNSEKMKKITTTTPQTTAAGIPITTTASYAITEVIYKYRTAFYVLLVIVLLAILGFVAYKWFVPSSSS